MFHLILRILRICKMHWYDPSVSFNIIFEDAVSDDATAFLHEQPIVVVIGGYSITMVGTMIALGEIHTLVV